MKRQKDVECAGEVKATMNGVNNRFIYTTYGYC
jgi:hypothetical protein